LDTSEESISAGSSGTILVAIDFSGDSHEALLWACREAEMTGLPVTILHIIHDPASSPGFYRDPEGDWIRPMADVADEMMEDFLASFRAAHPSAALNNADVRLETGLPAGRIVEVAEAINAHLIVVGSRGRTGLPHILLGSVAERVVQLAPVPVVVVKQR